MRHGRGVRSPASLGVGVSVGRRQAVQDPGENPNLLLWTEEFQQATWAKTSATVAADYGDPSFDQADRVTNSSATSAVRQISATASSTGAAAVAVVSAQAAWARESVSGTFDGLAYTFSVYLKDESGGGVPGLRLRIDRSGGFLRCSIEDTGDEGIYGVYGAQLEQAASASPYQRREGA